MVALVIEPPKKKYAIVSKDGTGFIWDFKEINSSEIKKENIPAISIANDPNIIDNKNAIAFPKDWGKVNKIIEAKRENEEEKLRNLGRKEESELLQEYDYESDDDEQSILVQKLREHVIRFEKLLGKFLDPDIPTRRKLKQKFWDERKLFRSTGYKDFINTIDLKVEALCSFEKYDITQFCKGDDDNWFKNRIANALKGDFYSAQQVVNSVMQIVKEEEYAVPKRRLVTKLK